MTLAIYLILVGIVLTIFLLFIILRSGSKQATNIVKTEEEGLHAIVHELRAPLVAIKDSAALMLSQNLDRDEEKSMLNLIHEQSTKLLEQVSQILDSAKVQDGKFVLRKSMGDLGQTVKDDVSMFTAEAKRKNITINTKVDTTVPSFWFDQVRITEVISNLVSNSLKYTNEGGTINVSVTKKDEFAVLSVQDNGMGISPDKQKKLFQKFANLNDGAGKEGIKISSGLGLFITKGIVDAHGGTIEVTSAVGKGTTMTVSLPIKLQDDSAAPTTTPTPAKPQAQPQTPTTTS